MKQAVHFGGGNIGRGFIGEILHDNGFSITFVDVNDAMVDRINRDHKYLIEIYDDIKVEKIIRNVSGVNSRINPEAVSKAILESDIVTCSVGPNNLKYIAKNIADGISSRYTNQVKENFDVIACENMVGGSQALKDEIYKYLDDKIKLYAELYIGFPNTSVDRIVPNIKYDSITTVGVEAYKEWIIETKYSKTYPTLKLEHAKYVSDIQPYTERKLLSVNTGHAAIAYGGLLLGYEDVVSALEDPTIEKHVREVLKETGLYLQSTYNLDEDEHKFYINRLIERFRNKDINDKLTRIARNPIQKLGLNERFVIPLMGLYKLNLPYDALIRAIASVFLFDYEKDAQSVTLQYRMNTELLSDVIKDVTGIYQEELVLWIQEEVIGLRVIHNI